MKILNIFSCFLVLVLISSCNQLETELANLDIPTEATEDLDITLAEEDYEFVGKTFGTFDSEEEAKQLIPDILAENYPHLGNGSSAVVCYDLYNPIRINNEAEFELTEEDYEALDQSYGNLSSERDIFEAVAYKYPSPEANDVVTLTYEWYCAGCPDQGTQESKVTYYDGSWYNAYVPTSEDYTFMGQSYPNFDSRSTGRARIGTLLNQRYLFDEEGTIRTAVFVYTYVDNDGDRQFVDFMTAYHFDGAVWQPINDVVSQCLQLGHDGDVWVPDNTIKYSLTADDYAAIAAATADSFPEGSSNLAQYGNFNTGTWSAEQIYDGIGNQLIALFPEVEGQKYLVSYDTYPGGLMTVHLIYQGGEYVEVK